MKKLPLIVLFCWCSIFCWAQQKTFTPVLTLKFVPTGLVLGNAVLQGEYHFYGRNSLTAKIGIPVSAQHTFQYNDKDAAFHLKAFSFLAGYRTYLSKKYMRGLYFEPYFKYANQTGEGTGSAILNNRPVVLNFDNEYNGAGIGAQLGTQFFIGKRVVLDVFFLGPEINSARNKFKSTEMTNNLAWTSAEADDAVQQIKDFIDQFPFIGHKTIIMADKQNRTVTADFKGALPGYRIGFSVGIAL